MQGFTARLNPNTIEFITEKIQGVFSDVFLDLGRDEQEVIKTLLLHPVLPDIADGRIEINKMTTKNIFKKYFGNQKDPQKKKTNILITAYVMALYYSNPRPDHLNSLLLNQLPFNNEGDGYINEVVGLFVHNYPQYRTLPLKELKYLTYFRDYFVIASLLIPLEKGNKGRLLDICGRLEGSGEIYKQGGGQTLATTRRIEIMEIEEARLESNQFSLNAGYVHNSVTTTNSYGMKNHVGFLHNTEEQTMMEVDHNHAHDQEALPSCSSLNLSSGGMHMMLQEGGELPLP